MKHRLPLPRFLLATGIATALASVHPLLAQAPSDGAVPVAAPAPSAPPATPATVPPTAPAPAKDDWIIPDMELSKPKLSEVVDFLRQATGVSIVVAADVQDREVPYLNLQNVSARCVLEAICGEGTGLALRCQEEDGNHDLYHIVLLSTSNDTPPELAGNSSKDKTESVDFKGGTLFELQLLLHSKMGANIVLPLGAGGIKVPPLRLRGVSALGALHAALIGAGSNGAATNLGVTRITDDHGGHTVRLLKVFSQPARGAVQPGEAQRVVRVFSLRVPASLTKKAEELDALREDPKRQGDHEELTRAMGTLEKRTAQFMEETRHSVEVAVAAQRTTRGLGSQEMPELAVHWATKIVIVTGREDDMNIVAEVMSAMGGAPVGEAIKK